MKRLACDLKLLTCTMKAILCLDTVKKALCAAAVIFAAVEGTRLVMKSE